MDTLVLVHVVSYFPQGFVELAALKDILEPFLDAESRKNFEESKQHLGAWDIEGNER